MMEVLETLPINLSSLATPLISQADKEHELAEIAYEDHLIREHITGLTKSDVEKVRKDAENALFDEDQMLKANLKADRESVGGSTVRTKTGTVP